MNSVCIGCKHNNEGCLKNKQPNKYGCMFYSKIKKKKNINKAEIIENIGEIIFLIIDFIIDVLT